MYVCVYVFMHVCMSVCHVGRYVRMYVRMCTIPLCANPMMELRTSFSDYQDERAETSSGIGDGTLPR